MTRDDVMRLEGRELDAAVTELVFRTSVEWYDETPWMNVGGEAYLAEYQPIPRYSTDIAAAWEVVGHLGRTWDVHLSRHFSGEYTCTFDRFDNGNYRHTTAKADTAPLAICRAALLAVARHSLAKNGGGEA